MNRPTYSGVRPIVATALAIVVSLGGAMLVLRGQDSTRPVVKRAKPPAFSAADAEVFFADLFSKLEGARPARAAIAAAPQPNSGAPPPAAPVASAAPVPAPAPAASPSPAPSGSSPAPAMHRNAAWSKVVSRETIEDEIKNIKLSLDANVKTPSDFAGRGHKLARRDFAILAVMFSIIAEYDGEVRWKEVAPVGRTVFARSAANAKAGGNQNVYKEATQRKQDLQGLVVDGQPIAGDADAALTWEFVADRSPLMMRLEAAFDERLKPWTGAENEFQFRSEDVVREAEIVAALSTTLLMEGMPDGDDDDYRAIAVRMLEAAQGIGSAAKAGDQPRAVKAAGDMTKACADCHESYRS